jgi:hypothetical protein
LQISGLLPCLWLLLAAQRHICMLGARSRNDFLLLGGTGYGECRSANCMQSILCLICSFYNACCVCVHAAAHMNWQIGLLSNPTGCRYVADKFSS